MITMDQLRDVALTADRERITPIVQQYLKENPDVEKIAKRYADMPARDAMRGICKEFPALAIFSMFPQAITFIETIQAVIRQSIEQEKTT